MFAPVRAFFAELRDDLVTNGSGPKMTWQDATTFLLITVLLGIFYYYCRPGFFRGNLYGTVLASFAIGWLTDLIGAGRLLSAWPDMPSPLGVIVNFFATTSMAQVMVFALIVVFLQFRPAGLFPQKGRMVES